MDHSQAVIHSRSGATRYDTENASSGSTNYQEYARQTRPSRSRAALWDILTVAQLAARYEVPPGQIQT